MKNDVEEYLKAFKHETCELIVRISWCGKKGGGDFGMLGPYCKARARFDQALNVKTGELIGGEAGFFWLEWLVPKKRFFKSGYQFKTGRAYRILAREYIPREGDHFKSYYIEQVLEYDVKERQLDAAYQFENQFEETDTEQLVLVKKRICGWAVKAGYRMPAAMFIASVDCKTNALSETCGRLAWTEKDTRSKLRFNFDDMGIYRVRVRKNKGADNTWMLLGVSGKAADARLEKIREEYLKPVVIDHALGTFKLNREFNRFEGQIDYPGETCSVYLSADEGETTADAQLRKLSEVCSNLPDWDARVRAYAADELWELANEWLDEGEAKITREQFVKRMAISLMIIEKCGRMQVMFDGDEMFTDHIIVVNIDENGVFCAAKLEG